MRASLCVTKKGDRLWLLANTGQPVLGRREIADIQFEKHMFKKFVREEI